MKGAVPAYHHVSLRVRSAEASVAFYRALFGFTEVLRHAGPVVMLAQASTGVRLELIEGRGDRSCAVDDVHLGFGIDDLDAFQTRLGELGLRPACERHVIGDERLLFLRDPDGYLIEINDNLRP